MAGRRRVRRLLLKAWRLWWNISLERAETWQRPFISYMWCILVVHTKKNLVFRRLSPNMALNVKRAPGNSYINLWKGWLNTWGFFSAILHILLQHPNSHTWGTVTAPVEIEQVQWSTSELIHYFQGFCLLGRWLCSWIFTTTIYNVFGKTGKAKQDQDMHGIASNKYSSKGRTLDLIWTRF